MALLALEKVENWVNWPIPTLYPSSRLQLDHLAIASLLPDEQHRLQVGRLVNQNGGWNAVVDASTARRVAFIVLGLNQEMHDKMKTALERQQLDSSDPASDTAPLTAKQVLWLGRSKDMDWRGTQANPVQLMEWMLEECIPEDGEGLSAGQISQLRSDLNRCLFHTQEDECKAQLALAHMEALVLANKLKIGAVAAMVAPYPTLGEISKRAAGQYYVPRLFDNPTVKRVVGAVQRFLP